MAAYIYLLQDGHDKGTNVYKIGRTVQKGGDSRTLNRLMSYSNGTMVYNIWNVDVSMVNAIENKIKEEFNQTYYKARGLEWFEGDVNTMKEMIEAIIKIMTIRWNCKYDPANGLVEIKHTRDVWNADADDEVSEKRVAMNRPDIEVAEARVVMNMPNIEVTEERLTMKRPNIKLHEARIAVNNNEAANIFLEDVRHILRLSKGKVLIRNERNVWVSDKSVVGSLLLKKCLNANIVDAKLRPYSAFIIKAKNIINATLFKLDDDPLFISNMWKSTLGKLCFEDGVYDFTSRSFTKWEDVTDVYTTVVINRPFPERNDEIINQVYERVFKSAFGEEERIMDFLKLIARGLAGCVEDKHFGVGMGKRQSGKGIVVEMCQAAFEGYVNTIESKCLMERSGNCDPAKRDDWMKDCEFTRLTFSNDEFVYVSDKRRKIDGNVIKKFASGGDELISWHSRPFRVQSRMFIMCNNLPQVTPIDAMETMVTINFPFKFVSKEEIVKSLPFFRESDDTLRHWVNEREVSNAFIHMILDAYEDAAMVMNTLVSKETLNCRENAGDKLILFRSLFKITDNDDDFIPVSEVHEILQSRGVNMLATTIKQRLTSMGSINTLVRFANNKNSVQSYTRIILKPSENPWYSNDVIKLRAFIDQCLVAVEDPIPNKPAMIKSSDMYAAFKKSKHYNGKGTYWFKQQLILNGIVPEKKTQSGIYHNCIVYFNYVLVEPNRSPSENLKPAFAAELTAEAEAAIVLSVKNPNAEGKARDPTLPDADAEARANADVEDDQEKIQRIIAEHERRREYSRAYMERYRLEHPDKVKAYKKDLAERKKKEKKERKKRKEES